ncbi:MAG: molybdopterin-synthase adenylyltransferase MoeB [Pelolinea sp.]|nr:molybdopterin-synthase adenylyltransferase MoeB [Pelolinea sp.]
MENDFSPEEILRYSRHLVIPEIGLDGQNKLKHSSVLIIGCGGLGSIIALYLAASGVGRIGIVDYDAIELSNLQRQVIYKTDLIGTSKVLSARNQLSALNPDIRVDIFEKLFTSRNAEKIAAPYQILIDGTDNIPTRYLINDLCVFTGKPYVYGAVYRFSGQVGIFDSSRGACYRCIFPEPPPPESVPPCAVAGVVGVVPGLIGLFQATEVIKLILGIGSPLISQLLLFDALESKTNIINVPKNPSCKVCRPNPEITHLIDYEKFCNMTIRNQDHAIENSHSINSAELNKEIALGQVLRLIDLREPVEQQIIAIPNSENISFYRFSEEMKKWDKSKPVVLICHIGFLSAIARNIMAEAGFKDVKVLRGGIRAWARETDSSSRIY